MRDKNDFKYKIGFTGVSKTSVKLIQEEIDNFYDEKRRREALKIEIDLSKLGDIRKSADITREKLLVNEEEICEVIEAPQPVEVPDETYSDSPLDCDERMFMAALLYGGSASEAAKKCGKMVSMLADSVNEKLFDIFSDTVIGFSGDEPYIIEDYTDELKEIIPMN